MRGTRPRRRVDALVIGSGPGGAVTSALLAKAGRRVLVVEEGEALPIDSAEPFSKDEREQKYRNHGLTAALGVDKISYAEARVVGGGSEINAGLYHRTPDAMIAQWHTVDGVRDLSPGALEAHFAAIEAALKVTTPKEQPGPASVRLREGARALGWRSVEAQRFHDSSTRRPMSATFIPAALHAGAELLTQARALRIRRDKGTCSAELLHQGEVFEVQANAIFVAAGAIQTPALLRRSGLTRNIGNTLAMHPTIKMVAEFDSEMRSSGTDVPGHQIKEFSPNISLGCSVSSPAHLALALTPHRTGMERLQTHWNKMAIYYAMIQGRAVGTVRNVPGFRDALVRYSLNEGDRELLAKGLRYLATALLEAGARRIYPGISGLGPIESRHDLERLRPSFSRGVANIMSVHLFCSAPMGEHSRSAVNSYGQLHAAPGLYVADGSMLPSAPGVNPQGTIMAFAHRNVLRFLDRTAA